LLVVDLAAATEPIQEKEHEQNNEIIDNYEECINLQRISTEESNTALACEAPHEQQTYRQCEHQAIDKYALVEKFAYMTHESQN
jgi:hypothetical protein